jgi:hypothetical protein
MRWRDIRFEKPTEADGDEHGYILHLLRGGIVCRGMWGSIDGTVAWMPLSELPAFDRIPDPPEGWRFVQPGDAFDSRAKFWMHNRWEQTLNEGRYSKIEIYIVPIDPPAPPAPQYRPFASAAEFLPYRDKWIKHKLDRYVVKITTYNDENVWMGCASIGTGYSGMHADFTFEDGTPFGVRVE